MPRASTIRAIGARTGRLAAVSDVEVLHDRLDDVPGALRIEVELEHDSARASAYRFVVASAATTLVRGRALRRANGIPVRSARSSPAAAAGSARRSAAGSRATVATSSCTRTRTRPRRTRSPRRSAAEGGSAEAVVFDVTDGERPARSRRRS